MKKLALWALALACAAALAGCAAVGTEASTAAEAALSVGVLNDSTQGEGQEKAPSTVARVGHGSEASAVELSPEDAAALAALLESGSWNTAGTADCLDDCVLTIGGETVYYSSDCGTFNDAVKERCLSLTEAERSRVNAILEKYIILGAVPFA
ncbi:MAG: hypothetical protein ACI3W8_04175 [Oscillospiraceae bacterium]